MQSYRLILLALAMCAGTVHAQNVKVDWDRLTDFAPYKTYQWKKIPTPRTPTPEIEKLIQQAADVQLGAKGLKKIDTGEPDLYVGYSITLGQSAKQGSPSSTTDSSSWQAGSSWSAQTPSDKAARKGTLNIDMADNKRNLLIWRGSVITEVGDSVNDARVKISKGISKAFAKYPPPAK
jgi:hypothetical protein